MTSRDIQTETTTTSSRDKTMEWSPSHKWNPFNSYKLLAQVYRWRLIVRGQPIPQPALVTVDPINLCNLSCQWCNASFILERRSEKISRPTLLELADFLASWQGSPQWPAGVEGVCIAGGGEPLLHPDIGDFIEACVARGIEVGVVTNGTCMDRFLEPLSLCTWVGVSVDAGTAKTFRAMKGKDFFGKVCDNISMLNEYLAKHPCRLGSDRPGYGVSYKFLLYNGNIHDILPAVRMAKQLGCKNFHLRPAGISWDRIGTGRARIFDQNVLQELNDQLAMTRTLEDERFGIYGITHKFDPELNRANHFSSCHAIFMTAVFMPPRDPQREKFCLGLCCDRRGDRSLESEEPMTNMAQVETFWGSDAHWRMFDCIDLAQCPRCTYQPHNQIFEHVIEKDSMTYKFI